MTSNQLASLQTIASSGLKGIAIDSFTLAKSLIELKDEFPDLIKFIPFRSTNGTYRLGDLLTVPSTKDELKLLNDEDPYFKIILSQKGQALVKSKTQPKNK